MSYLKNVVIFGYGKFGNSIAKSIKNEENTNVLVVVNCDKEYELAVMDSMDVKKFNVESDASIEQLNIVEDSNLICAMDNNHENLFLALTLRGLYTSNYIVAISDSIHLTDKFKMAGVNKVIDIYTVSGKMINNILKIPVATKFLQGFMNRSHDYKFREIIIKDGSKLHEEMLDSVDFNSYNIIYIGMIDIELGKQFIFSTAGMNHKVDSGDILVCVGKDEDLDRFEKDIGGLS